MDRHAKKRACLQDGDSDAASDAGSNPSDEDVDLKEVSQLAGVYDLYRKERGSVLYREGKDRCHKGEKGEKPSTPTS